MTSFHSSSGGRYLTATQIRERFGGISDMTLWRWIENKDLGFPQPIKINGRRYWHEPLVVDWERSRLSREAA